MILNSAGFLAKNVISNYCFIFPTEKGINCLYIKRKNKEKKEKIIWIEERQKNFDEGKFYYVFFQKEQ